MRNIFNNFPGKLLKFVKGSLHRIIFIAIGAASTIWFIVRVIPKPQRATYPCMRVAAPLMSGFVIYLLTLVGTITAYSKARSYFKRLNYLYGLLFLVISTAGIIFLTFQKPETAKASGVSEWLITPNQPVGVAKGIYPGRVVWIHDPGVARWNGSEGNWWDGNAVSQDGTDNMMKRSMMSLTGKNSEKEAWEALFEHFNRSHGKTQLHYQAGQTIAIKINTNNTYSHKDSEEINATPQMVLSLLKSLINEAGVPQKNITVFDASRFITDNIFDMCHGVFPEVFFVDNTGGDGRIKSAYVENAIPYSVDNGKLATGLATCAVEADYLINMALLKGHVGQGVTLCAKNYYGATSIYSDWRKNAHDNFNQDREGKPKYMTFVDFLTHRDLGGKTMLFLIDGIYGSKLVNGVPGPRWKMAPFNNDWACSLLSSIDPVAIDAVALDFLRSEWPDAPDMAFSDQYLYEAAQADDPPSGSRYDPQRNDMVAKSLGVMEHWNNADEKMYSRNLGKVEGIDLVHITL